MHRGSSARHYVATRDVWSLSAVVLQPSDYGCEFVYLSLDRSIARARWARRTVFVVHVCYRPPRRRSCRRSCRRCSCGTTRRSYRPPFVPTHALTFLPIRTPTMMRWCRSPRADVRADPPSAVVPAVVPTPPPFDDRAILAPHARSRRKTPARSDPMTRCCILAVLIASYAGPAAGFAVRPAGFAVRPAGFAVTPESVCARRRSAVSSSPVLSVPSCPPCRCRRRPLSVGPFRRRCPSFRPPRRRPSFVPLSRRPSHDVA